MSEQPKNSGIGPADFKQGRNNISLEEIYDAASALGGPEYPVAPIRQIAAAGSRIVHRLRIESGILEMDFIVRTPKATPTAPYGTEVMEIFGGRCDHVECIPEFVSALAGWRYWILRLSAKKRIIEPLLQGVAAKCGCDPWLDARTSREIDQSVSEWLKWLNQRR